MPFQSDAQRKAVMAKLRGGGGPSGRSASPGDSLDVEADLATGKIWSLGRSVDAVTPAKPSDYRGEAGIVVETPAEYQANTSTGQKITDSVFGKETTGLEAMLMLAPLGTVGAGLKELGTLAVGPRVAVSVGEKLNKLAAAANALVGGRRLGLAVDGRKAAVSAGKNVLKGLAKALAGLGGAAGLSEYRRDNPLTERQDHALALIQRALETVGAYGLGQGLLGGLNGLLGQFRVSTPALLPAGSPGYTALQSANPLPASEFQKVGAFTTGQARLDALKNAAAWIYEKYSAIAGFTGGDWSKISKETIAASGFLASLAAAVQTYEQIAVSQAEDEAYESFKAGDPYNSPGTRDIFDTGAKMAGMAVVGTLGNPVEKISRYWNDGSFTSVLQQRGAVRAMERILEENKGSMSQADYEKAKADINDRLPTNMAGRSVDVGTSALNAFLRWQASDARERIRLEDSASTVEKILDGDTPTVPTVLSGAQSKSIRMQDSNAPEIAHPEYGKPYGEYWGQEARQAFLDLAPPGTPIKILRDPDALTEKKRPDGGTRALGSVEVPANPIQAAIWSISPRLDPFPGKDVGLSMIESGNTQPGQYRSIAVNPSIHEMDYDRAAGKAQKAKAGMFGPGRETTRMDVVPAFKVPAYALREPSALERFSTGSGASLMYSGNSGAFSKLGVAGTAIAQLWNAVQSLLGTAQHAQGGVRKPFDREIKLPKSVPSTPAAAGSVPDWRAAFDAAGAK